MMGALIVTRCGPAEISGGMNTHTTPTSIAHVTMSGMRLFVVMSEVQEARGARGAAGVQRGKIEVEVITSGVDEDVCCWRGRGRDREGDVAVVAPARHLMNLPRGNRVEFMFLHTQSNQRAVQSSLPKTQHDYTRRPPRT